MDTKVFVYGTLKRGGGNGYLLSSAQYLGAASTERRYRMESLGGFPGIVAGEGVILGEVYAVNDSTLDALDRLESNGWLYQRYERDVRLAATRELVSVWVYEYLRRLNGGNCPLLEGQLNQYEWLVDRYEVACTVRDERFDVTKNGRTFYGIAFGEATAMGGTITESRY